ncbi:MAG TPA: hypothetical protein PLD27_09935 [bacterium]|nr:hypothetical protein [bacterium]HOL48761.1 hypothetical protein [bacterium]HPQ19559.1 hypothetical protein [bacterium]
MAKQIALLFLDKYRFSVYLISYSNNQVQIIEKTENAYNNIINLQEQLITILRKNKIKRINCFLFLAEEETKIIIKNFPLLNETELNTAINFEKEKFNNKHSSYFVLTKKLLSEQFQIKNNIQVKFYLFVKEYLVNLNENLKNANYSLKYFCNYLEFSTELINVISEQKSYISAVQFFNKLFLNLVVENEVIFSKQIITNNIDQNNFNNEIETLIKYARNNYRVEINKALYFISIFQNEIIKKIIENSSFTFEAIPENNIINYFPQFIKSVKAIEFKIIFEGEKSENFIDDKISKNKIFILLIFFIICLFSYTPLKNYKIQKEKKWLILKFNSLNNYYENLYKEKKDIYQNLTEKEKIKNSILTNINLHFIFTTLDKIYSPSIKFDELNYTNKTIIIQGKVQDISILIKFYSDLQNEKVFKKVIITKSEKINNSGLILFSITGYLQ